MKLLVCLLVKLFSCYLLSVICPPVCFCGDQRMFVFVILFCFNASVCFWINLGGFTGGGSGAIDTSLSPVKDLARIMGVSPEAVTLKSVLN